MVLRLLQSNQQENKKCQESSSHKNPAGFAVYRPKFIAAEGVEPDTLGGLGEKFFEGVFSHEKGAEVWERAERPRVSGGVLHPRLYLLNPFGICG